MSEVKQNNDQSPAFGLLSIAISVVAVGYAIRQTNTAEEELAVLKQQVEQIEKHHAEELESQRKPFVAFVSNSLFYLEESKDGGLGFEHLEGGVVRNIDSVPRIKNFGNGPALDIAIKWVSDSGKSSKVAALEALHLFPDDESRVMSFPAELVRADCEGVVEIIVRDVSGTHHTTKQSFKATRRRSDGQTVIEFPELKSLPWDYLTW